MVRRPPCIFTIPSAPRSMRAAVRVDDPRLPSHFGRNPAGLVGEVRHDDGDDEDPQQPAFFKQRAAAAEEQTQQRENDEQDAQSDHEMIGQKRYRHRRPVLRANLVQSGDGGVEIPVDEKTEPPGMPTPCLTSLFSRRACRTRADRHSRS